MATERHQQSSPRADRRRGWGTRAVLAAITFVGAACAELQQAANQLAAAQPGGAVDLVANGGFEQPVVPLGRYQLFAPGQSFSGWQVIGARGNVAPISGQYRNSGITFNARSGAQWLDLTGVTRTATGVQQTVRTQPGVRYELRFFVGNVVGRGFGAASAVEVLVDGKSAGVFQNSGNVPGGQHWLPVRVQITAASAATTLAFVNRDAADNSCGLDDVSLVPAATLPAVRSLSGEYAYLGQGRCTVTQTGANVRMLCNWAPAGAGNHYEIRGTLAGDTITGSWYSHYAKKGWYRYLATVRPDGSIEQSQSEDPIRSNIQRAVLTRTR
jgi:hypothetical protein